MDLWLAILLIVVVAISCSILGFIKGVTTVKRLIQSGQINPYGNGKVLIIRRSEGPTDFYMDEPLDLPDPKVH